MSYFVLSPVPFLFILVCVSFFLCLVVSTVSVILFRSFVVSFCLSSFIYICRYFVLVNWSPSVCLCRSFYMLCFFSYLFRSFYMYFVSLIVVSFFRYFLIYFPCFLYFVLVCSFVCSLFVRSIPLSFYVSFRVLLCSIVIS